MSDQPDQTTTQTENTERPVRYFMFTGPKTIGVWPTREPLRPVDGIRLAVYVNGREVGTILKCRVHEITEAQSQEFLETNGSLWPTVESCNLQCLDEKSTQQPQQ